MKIACKKKIVSIRKKYRSFTSSQEKVVYEILIAFTYLQNI